MMMITDSLQWWVDGWMVVGCVVWYPEHGQALNWVCEMVGGWGQKLSPLFLSRVPIPYFTNLAHILTSQLQCPLRPRTLDICKLQISSALSNNCWPHFNSKDGRKQIIKPKPSRTDLPTIIVETLRVPIINWVAGWMVWLMAMVVLFCCHELS